MGYLADARGEALPQKCPRCGQVSDQEFYGPCTECRAELNDKFRKDES